MLHVPCLIGPLTREDYAQKYDLTKPRHRDAPMSWSKDSQKHDPLADKKNMLFELAFVLPLYAIINNNKICINL